MSCKCQGFSSENKTDICDCGHSYLDHLHVVLGECGKDIVINKENDIYD